MRIQKGDNVEIITGKDKGKKGLVERVVYTDKTPKIVIAGTNISIKHRRNTSNQQAGKGKVGGRIEVPMPMDVSNIMILCSKCGLKTRVEYRVEGDKKLRVCKKCHKEIN